MFDFVLKNMLEICKVFKVGGRHSGQREKAKHRTMPWQNTLSKSV